MIASPVGGLVAPGFEAVAEALAACVDEIGECGCGLAVAVHGTLVVDAFCGTVDGTRPWDSETLVVTYSCTKGVVATCAAILADRGQLDVDAPVARYWPEFATAGKEATTVGHLLDHTCGLPSFPGYPALLGLRSERLTNWELVTRELAASPPAWAPGSRAVYHALTFGYLVGELIRRVDGRSVGAFVREEIAEPLGLEYWIGLPPSRDHRVAAILAAEPASDGGAGPEASAAMDVARAAVRRGEVFSDAALPLSITLQHPDHLDFIGSFNRVSYRRAEIPGANGIGNAGALARLYAALCTAPAGTGRQPLVSHDVVERFTRHRVDVPAATPYGLGFQLLGDFLRPPGMGPRCFGHTGAGGNIGFADPDSGVAVGFVKNRPMNDHGALMHVLRALRRCL